MNKREEGKMDGKSGMDERSESCKYKQRGGGDGIKTLGR